MVHTMKKRRPGPPPGTARGELTARESYYLEQAEKVRMANASRRGELLERQEVKEAWAQIVLSVREAFLSLPAYAAQHGWVTREHEPALQARVDEILTQLSQGRGGARSRFTHAVSGTTAGPRDEPA
jgi:phage terminase Nu1 subunit (DNA packaging protein)